MAVAVCLAVVAQVLLLLQPMFAGALIESVEQRAPAAEPVLWLVASAVIYAVLVSVQLRVTGSLGEAIVFDMRRRLLVAFFRLRTLDQESRAPGWYASRIVADPPLVRAMVSEALVQAAQAVIAVVGAGVALLMIDTATFAAVAAFAVGSVALVAVAARPVGGLRATIQEAGARITVDVQRAATRSRLLRAHNAFDAWRLRIEEQVAIAFRAGVRLNRVYSVFGPLSAMLMQFAYASTVVVGGYRVASGAMAFADLIVFLMFFSLFSTGISTASGVVMELREAAAGHARLRELGDAPASAFASVRAAGDGLLDGPLTVELDDVWFRYGDDAWALAGASFVVPSGSLTALVGSSGSGKSTCLGLVEGFFEPETGRVLVSGSDLRDLDLPRVRDRIGYVEQDMGAVAGTVRENLALGSVEPPDDDEMRRVLSQVALDRVVRLGAAGLDLPVGEDGARLSGGERQRLAIARALLRAPSLLVLDEPTSSLDGISELGVRSVLRSIRPGATILLTAHRLSTILDADWIVVLDEGRVVDQGTHQELLSRCSRYVELVRAQSPPVAAPEPTTRR
jgi:ABC-type multidrug transport system fused ATPase/permease subunit